MKRGILILIWVLFLVPNLLAVEIKLSKTDYSPEETLQAEIAGNFLSLANANILIYKDKVPRSMPVISALTKQDNVYHFYAVLPNQEGNFSLKIEGAEYVESGKTTKNTLIKDFKIEKSNQTTLQINPGFINVKEREEFSIKVKSLAGNLDLTTTLFNDSKSISLVEYSEKTIKFSVPETEETQTNLQLGGYNVPVFIINKQNTTYVPVNDSDSNNYYVNYSGSGVVFEPAGITGKIIAKQDYFFRVILKNMGPEKISITLGSDIDATIEPESLDLEGRKDVIINITIPVFKEDIAGELVANFNNNQSVLPVFLEIIENESQVDLGGTSLTEKLDCNEFGSICESGEECDGETAPSLQGVCCIGKCRRESGSNWVVGIILLVVVVAVMVLLYLKSKKKQKPKSTDDILKERQDKFNQKMKGSPQTEVKGKLDSN